ncbi:glycosyltransferase [Kiritimatiellaeota bacterium B1221]|nr:glycosyltransferase [Kiritimatiellaeota bacterium B1221]
MKEVAKVLPPARVMILSDAIPQRNGVGTYYHDLMEHLEGELGHVEMIPARANCIFKKNKVSIPLPGDASQNLYLPNVIPILHQIKKERPDVLIAPTLGPFALLARLVARYRKLPLIFGYHTSLNKLASLYWQGRFGRLSAWYLKRASRVMFRQADRVVVNTEEMKAEALSLGAKQVEVMGTSIARPIVTTPLKPFDGKIETVLFAGRLAKEKRVMKVAEAAGDLPDTLFRIAGDGPLMNDLEKKAKGLHNLNLTGWLTREDLLVEIDRADVVVLPSEHESFGSIALEVMARGRVMLVSKNCGILHWPELAKGLCVIQEDESVADAIRRLKALSPEELKVRARTAQQATLDMNTQTMQGWQNIIGEVRRK